MNIGARIKKRREELNMSQEELAKLANYKSRSSINKIERDGRGLPQEKIEAIAKALGVTPSYLMGWEEENEEHYYLSKETREVAEEIGKDKELALLFKAARDVSSEDLKTVHELLKALKRKENHEDD